jgi:site-specific DNA-methyltransferase (adenine-specific)
LTVDLIIADPPYNIGYEYDLYDDNRPDQEYLDWTYRWIHAAARLLKPDGAFWIAIGDEYAAEVKWIAQRQVGLHLRNWVIWYYTFGVLCRDKFSRSHTHLLYFVKDPNKYKFRSDRIRVPSARRLVYRDARTHPAGRVPDNTWILRPQDVPWSFTELEDTWYFARVAGTFKERARFVQCQLPEKLLGRIILACTDPQDLVFDPFVGSGSSLVVAKKLGRRWLGCELSPHYTRWAEQRISWANVGDALEGPDDPLLSAPSTPINFQVSALTKQERSLMKEGILKCFIEVSEGYSIDRLLADPVLSARFVDACSVARLPGRPVDWNLSLLQLRKSGELSYRSTRQTKLGLRDIELALPGAEIALRKLLDEGFPSLDYILADPKVALRFDDYARRIVPGLPTLHYRWAALHLRKIAGTIRKKHQHLTLKELTELGPPLELVEGVENHFSHEPGLYYLQQRVGSKGNFLPIYIGQTSDLARVIGHLAQVRDRIAILCRRPGDLFIAALPFRERLSYIQLGARRYEEARKYQPELNYLGVKDANSSEIERVLTPGSSMSPLASADQPSGGVGKDPSEQSQG